MKSWQKTVIALVVGGGALIAVSRLVRSKEHPTASDIISNLEKYKGKTVSLVGTILIPGVMDSPALDDGTGVLMLGPATSDVSDMLIWAHNNNATVTVAGIVTVAPDGTPYLYAKAVID